MLICHFHSSMRPTVCQMLPGNQANGKKVILSLQDGKHIINPIPATRGEGGGGVGGTVHKISSISTRLLTLRPPNFHRLSNLLAESKFPSKYTLTEKYLDRKVFDKITQNLSGIRSEALIGPRRSLIVLAIVYE